jgi:RNA polymerase sigma factor (sigma-70 family)
MIARAEAPPRVLDDAARALASDPKLLAYARARARRMAARSRVDLDILESGAMFGLCQAAAAFDPAIGVRFITFAAPRINGAIVDEMRRHGFAGRYHADLVFQSIAAPVPGGDGATLAEELADDMDPVAMDCDSADFVEAVLKSLPPVHRDVMSRYYLSASGVTNKSVGQAIGLSDSRVSQLHIEALELIREEGLVDRALSVHPRIPSQQGAA